eukprot:SAG31_NODE_29771_length_390_cov_0.707904_1_plen_23_part_10
MAGGGPTPTHGEAEYTPTAFATQ